ncbi:hypothetical protein [Nannocystis sp. SCPEA4]|uniref:hypothetical protein n=1 Tax=Nannocystis sp. SCPEA4 TaxID=2996787 RepID=UPI00226FA22F|nr:hypothetical protein [Nannocystis sp. SCPEA4]MCY1053512.1 hypothetical protein [Nannocystis sp. SCPEA4]
MPVVAKRDDLQPPPPAIDEEIRQPDEKTASSAVQVRRPGLGEFANAAQAALEFRLESFCVHTAESACEGARFSHFPAHLWMERERFPLLIVALHATESE